MTGVFFRFYRVASLIFAIAILIFCYSSLPEDVAVQHNEFGRPIGYLERSDFFYIVGAVIVGFNLLMGLTRDATLKVDWSKLNPSSLWANAKESLNSFLADWFNGFVAVVNTILVFVLLGLNAVNRQVDQSLDRDYSWVLLAIGVIVLLGLFLLPLRILFTNPKSETA